MGAIGHRNLYRRTAPSARSSAAFEDQRDEQVAVAVVVEQDGQLVAVVALHGSLPPALADDPFAEPRTVLLPALESGAERSLSHAPHGPG